MYSKLTRTLLAFNLISAIILTVFGKINFFTFLAFSAANFGVFFLFRRLRNKFRYRFQGGIDDISAKTNFLRESILLKRKLIGNLPDRLDKVSFLFEASQRLIKIENTEETLKLLVSVTGELFPGADNILLYGIHKDRLALISSFKRKPVVIKQKYGDMIDVWVLKNNQLLMVEDLTKDFRFDPNRIDAFTDRGIHSLVVSPFSAGERTSGIIRVESKRPHVFNLDDSRILRAICDLGVLVLERANLFKRTEEMAIRDALTSLYLRDYFFTRFKEEMKRALHKKSGLGLAILDIDNFKKINDTYGHIVGDLVLKKLGKILLDIVGDSGNICCRFGGEEFVFYIVECNKKELVEIAQKIRKQIANTSVHFRRKLINFTVSVGLAHFPEHGDDVLDLLDKADHNLYTAKNSGKNKVKI